VDFLIRSGRAVLFPVYKGTYERGPSIGAPLHEYRDLMIAWSKDLGRALDYLETRPDVDRTRLGYFGLSLGASAGVVFTALEPRFRASVLLAGGLSSIDLPGEIDGFNFAPRVRVPTLMVNGRDDFEEPLEAIQKPLFQALGTAPADKRHAVLDGGHLPRLQDTVREVLDWLDRHLGPVDSK
jgi:dienelactone hydrolase